MIGRCSLSTLVAMAALLTNRAGAQPPPGRAVSKSGVPVGGQELFTLALNSTPVGEIPGTIRLVQGNVEVVLKDGTRMLKAATASTFLITLPQVLPQDFTLEFDLIPKAGGPPPDLSIEGTPTVNQGPGSAHLLWQADGYLAVIGGGQDNYEQPMPEDLRAALPGVLTEVGVSFEGNTVKLYTNGRRLYTLERQFARGRVLRVSLGGVDDANAVYLAGLRVATGAPVIAEGPQQSESRSQASTAASTAVTGLVVTIDGQKKATLKWTAVPDAFGYAALRWKPSDLTCCKNLSPPGAASITEWLDGVLADGTYAYRVYATTATGTVFGETRVTVKQGTISEGITGAGSGTIASTAPPAPPPILTPNRPVDPITSTSIMSNAPAATIAPITGTPNQAWLRWTPATGAVNYIVLRREGANPEERRTANPITQSYFNDAIANHAITYSYQVRAYQADGKYGNSAWVTFTPPPMANPAGFIARQVGAGEVMLSWQKVDGASEYRLEGPGLPSGIAATSEVFLGVGGLQADAPLSWKVVAVYGGSLFDPSTRPTASITLPSTPWRSVPWLSMRNGAGSLIEEIAYYSSLIQSGAIKDCKKPDTPWDCMVPAYDIITKFPVDEVFYNRLMDIRTPGTPGKGGRPVYDVAFADMRDMGAGRHVYCTDAGIAPANETLCWASTHGPAPGATDWGDPVVALNSTAGPPNRGWTFFRQGIKGTLFAAFDGTSQVGGYGTDQYSFAKASTVLDTEGPKRLPHACLACHGGRYDPTSHTVVETSLIPLDPSALVFSGTVPEETIRQINMVVLNANPSPAVAAYIRGLYRGTPEVAGTTADRNYVPRGWWTAPDLYRKVVRPYCQGCHLQQQPRIDFASYENFTTFKAAILTAVCSTRTMPHAEAPFKALWRDGKDESLPDYLMTTLGLGKCTP
jgi:hypothetical protein